MRTTKEDMIEREFPDLVKRYGRESVAKSVAVVLLTERKLPVEEVVKLTGLPREYVERLEKLHLIMGTDRSE